MTDQVDVGWASPPFGLKEIEEGKTRVVARASDSALVRGQTIRVLVANTDALAKRKDAIGRFMKAYREAIAYMYGDNPQVMKDYGEFCRGVRSRGKSACAMTSSRSRWSDPDEIHGLDALMDGGRDAEVHCGAADDAAGIRTDPVAEVIFLRHGVTFISTLTRDVKVPGPGGMPEA